ncbi:putative lipoprotein NlpE involved in copper resistance [Flavobacterium sp. 28YEA47A]|uniref:hypothetical protein n=1 Tax=Flavobacterium sp. 28YEA47A TaxID=3156276 RepID=UPI00351210F4
MKKIQLICLFAIMILLGCNNDDDNRNDTSLRGVWKLIEVNGTIAGIRDQFEPGVIQWNFNASNHTFTVVNNNTDESKQDIFESGTYNYSISNNVMTPETCARSLSLAGTNYGCYITTNTTLQINQGEADGVILKFIR